MTEDALIVARAYRRAAKALEKGKHLELECCGIPLDDLGQCRNRPGHNTLTHPDPYEVVEKYRAKMEDA